MNPGGRPGAALRLHDQALLLRRFPYGESSLVLHVLTPESGRVALLAKGAYRPSSGFFAVFDLFDTLEVRWSAQSQEELGLVTRAALRTRRPTLASDLLRYRVALGLLELAHLTGREAHEERRLFQWLEAALDLLAAGAAAPGVVQVSAQLGLLRANGLEPALEACASCGSVGRERDGNVPFAPSLGGRLCADCAASERARGRKVEAVSLNVLRIAASLMGASPAMLAHTRLAPPMEIRVQALVEHFLEYHLETRPRTSRGARPPRP